MVKVSLKFFITVKREKTFNSMNCISSKCRMNDAVEYGALHTLSPALFGGEGTGSATGLGFLTVSKIQVVLTSI